MGKFISNLPRLPCRLSETKADHIAGFFCGLFPRIPLRPPMYELADRGNFRGVLQLKNLTVFSYPNVLNPTCKISNRSPQGESRARFAWFSIPNVTLPFHFRQRFPSLFALWLHCISNKHHYTFYNEASIERKSLGRLLKKVSLLKRFSKKNISGPTNMTVHFSKSGNRESCQTNIFLICTACVNNEVNREI